MNGTGLGIVGILIVVLIAISIGAQQMDNQRIELIEGLKSQRQELIDTTEEALQQRDSEMARAAALAEQNVELSRQVDEKTNLAASQQAEIERLTQEIAQKEVEIAQLKSVPVTGQPEAGVPNGGTNEPDPAIDTRANMADTGTCLLSEAGLKQQVQAIVVVLSGLVLLGGGGYAIYHNDPGRKVTVRMSREQLKEYVRYQRGR